MVPGGSLANLLAWRVAEQADYPFLYVEDAGPWTVGQIGGAAQRLADELGGCGIGAGDRVVVRVGNDERFLAGLVAVWLRRAAVVALHPAAPTGDIVGAVGELGAKAVVEDADGAGPAALGVAVVVANRVGLDAPNSTRLDVPDVDDRDEAVLLLTSGSTGTPKGVVLSHANAWETLAGTASAFRRDTGPTPLADPSRPPNLVASPFAHTAGLVRLMFALYVGRRLVVLRKFDPFKAKAAIDAHGIDNLTINPTMLRLLLDVIPEGEDLGPVRYVSSGTAPLPPSLRVAFENRFGVPVLQTYGQTEAFGSIAIENVRDVLAGRRRPDSVGRPVPSVEVRIVGPDGEPAGTGEEGEILARSRAVTAGYASAGGDLTSPVDADGWLHTGDLGHLDADGYLYVTGRLKNIIICGGFNIVPEELELKLERDPDVREAAVVGVPDVKRGEIPVALVEGTGDPSAILDRTKAYLAGYKRPRHLFVVAELPRLVSGKVDKPAARRLAEALLRSGR